MRRQLFSRFQRLWLGLLGSLVLIVCAVTLAGRANTAYSCLEIADMLSNRTVFDLVTGQSLGLSTNKAQNIPGMITVTNSSKDGKYLAYLVRSIGGSMVSLWIKPIGGIGVRPSVQIWDNSLTPNTVMQDFVWSPVQNLLAYHWQVGSTHYLALADANGNEQQLTSFSSSQGSSDVFLEGWSADGAYLSASSTDDVTHERTIMIWSVPDLTQVAVYKHLWAIPDQVPYRTAYTPDVAWTPQGHTLAFVSQDDNKFTLMIVSADIGRELQFQLSGVRPGSGQYLQWSPDGKYVAVVTVHKALAHSRLAIFGIDRTYFGEISNKLVGESDGNKYFLAYPLWSADGQSIFYVTEVAHGATKRWDLVVFRLASGRENPLLSSMVTLPNYSPDTQYAALQWIQEGHLYAGIIKTATGQLVTASKRDASELYDTTSFGVVAWSSEWVVLIDSPNYSIKELWAVNLKTAVSKPLSSLLGTFGGISLAPNGHIVTWSGIEHGVNYLYVRDLESDEITAIGLAATNRSGLEAIWAPDSSVFTLIYFIHNGSGYDQFIDLYDAKGHQIRQFKVAPNLSLSYPTFTQCR
jgi:Tol biopolymer transport system component